MQPQRYWWIVGQHLPLLVHYCGNSHWFRAATPINQWYDEERRETATAKHAAYMKTLESAATQAIVSVLCLVLKNRDHTLCANYGVYVFSLSHIRDKAFLQGLCE